MSEMRERVHIEEGPKRVRAYLGGELIADTKRLKLVWEVPYYPAYYFPREDVQMDSADSERAHPALAEPGRRSQVQPRLVVQDAAPREHQDRRAGRVLQRTGRPRRGRRAAGATEDQVLLSKVVELAILTDEEDAFGRRDALGDGRNPIRARQRTITTSVHRPTLPSVAMTRFFRRDARVSDAFCSMLHPFGFSASAVTSRGMACRSPKQSTWPSQPATRRSSVANWRSDDLITPVAVVRERPMTPQVRHTGT